MIKKYCIYKHTCPNGKVYIGQTGQKPEKRYGRDGCKYEGCTAFYNAIQKYGWDNIEHEILCNDLTLEEANIKEAEFIQLYQSYNRKYGYNLRLGGNNGTHSEETKIKMSKWQIGKVLSDETRKKISEKRIGQKDSIETRLKKSGSQKGKKLSDEAIQKLVNAHKQKVDLVQLGRTLGYANKGRKHSEETREKVSKALKGKNSKRVLCIETDIIYDSISDAESLTNINRQNIGKVCNGKAKTAGGYHWKFI